MTETVVKKDKAIYEGKEINWRFKHKSHLVTLSLRYDKYLILRDVTIICRTEDDEFSIEAIKKALELIEELGLLTDIYISRFKYLVEKGYTNATVGLTDIWIIK